MRPPRRLQQEKAVVDEKELGDDKDREKGFHLALRREALEKDRNREEGDRVEGFVGIIMLGAREEEEKQGVEEVVIIITSTLFFFFPLLTSPFDSGGRWLTAVVDEWWRHL